ncbi:MAG: outer membrane protein assembly factor BamB [Pirellulaceae bacterium]|jgi:outer membrane protein assembly factor BamB
MIRGLRRNWMIWAGGMLGLAFVIGLTLVAQAAERPRIWKDASGKHEINAEFVKLSGATVTLRMRDGKTVDVPLEKLSSSDQKVARRKSELLLAPKTETSVATKKDDTIPVGTTSDWPQWRGPNRDGASAEKNLLKSWPESGPELGWQIKGLGRGYSSVVVAAGKIFTIGKRSSGTELIALNFEDGKELWSCPVGGGQAPNGTPTYANGLVYAIGFGGDLVCVDAESGQLKWRKTFQRDFGGKMMSGWGYSESPLVDDGKLICTPGGGQSMMVALNAKTGESIWATAVSQLGSAGKDGAGYSSIVVSNATGVKQYVQLVGKGVIGVSASNGQLLWSYNRVANNTANVPTPLISGDFVFCSSGYGDGGSALLRLARQGTQVMAEEVYYMRANETQNHHGGMVMLGDEIYMGHGHNNGFPLCLDWKSGRDRWRPGRGPGRGSAAIAYADGHLYFRYEDGVVSLIEANENEYRVKGQFTPASVIDKGWAHPVVSHGKLLLRDQDVLMCYEIGTK